MKISRIISTAIKRASKDFKVVLLMGPRQVGKTTLLKEIDKENRSYVTLDDLNMRSLALNDPAAFISRLKLPTLIDEVQYAPEIFSYIKIEVDKSNKNGQFWLTGSQQFDMMKNINESLAGRVAILRLQGISISEEEKRQNNIAFLPSKKVLLNRHKNAESLNIRLLYKKMWRGFFPKMLSLSSKSWELFYESYVATYIQRDIRDYLRISDSTSFLKFMQIVATRTGQMLNYAAIATDVGVSQSTIKSWINALQASGIVYLLQPYYNNKLKRLIKTPKLYFMDTGLCCFLSGWLNSDTLERGSMSGAMLETFAISEIVKSYTNQARRPNLYYYRDKEKNEIDLIIEENNELYPIEIKKTANINNIDLKAFKKLEDIGDNIADSCVLCFVDQVIEIKENINAVPISWI